jgi:hypothetical protein
MIINAGDDLGLPQHTGQRVHQPQSAHDADLPRLHRPGRSNLTYEAIGRFRGRGCAKPCRSKIRLIVRIRIRFDPTADASAAAPLPTHQPAVRPDADTTPADATDPPAQRHSRPGSGGAASTSRPPPRRRPPSPSPHLTPPGLRPNVALPPTTRPAPILPPRVWTPREDVRLRVAQTDHCRASPGEHVSHIRRHRTHRIGQLTADSGSFEIKAARFAAGRCAACLHRYPIGCMCRTSRTVISRESRTFGKIGIQSFSTTIARVTDHLPLRIRSRLPRGPGRAPPTHEPRHRSAPARSRRGHRRAGAA